MSRQTTTNQREETRPCGDARPARAPGAPGEATAAADAYFMARSLGAIDGLAYLAFMRGADRN